MKTLRYVITLNVPDRENPVSMREYLHSTLLRAGVRNADVHFGVPSREHQDVREFSEKFDLPLPKTPTLMDSPTAQFRINRMLEEVKEFEAAHLGHDLHDAADALIDLAYIVHGTALMMGLPWEELWYEVHAANMRKVRAARKEDSKHGTTLDIVKPEGWKAPDHTHALAQAEFYGNLQP